MALTKIPASLLDTASGINGLIYPTSDGTSGQFLKTDGSGNLTFATITTYTDSDVETYLDGGTSTPTFATATVSGTLTVTGDLDITGNVNSYNVTDLDVTDQTITLGAGQTEANSGGSGIIIDGSNASILWDETNDVFDFNKGLTTLGSVGIGTTSPVKQLTLAAANTSTVVATALNHGASNYWGVGSYTDQSFRIAKSHGLEDANTYFAIDRSNGNVGIGMTSPSAGLHVETDVNPVLKLDRGSANNTNANLYYNGTLTGQLSAANAEFQISAAGSSTPTTFFTNGSERMRIDSSGKVIIKTDYNSPQLSTMGYGDWGNLPLQLQDSSLTNTAGYVVTGIGFGYSSETTAAIVVTDEGGSAAQSMSFITGTNTGAVPRMTIDQSGNVGIGTTSPATELQIGDYSDNLEQITIATASDQTGRINFYNNNSTEGASIRVIGGGNGAKMYFANRYDSDSDKVTFDLVSGRVGVGAGTTSPDDTLHVDSPGATARIRIGSGNAAYYTKKGYLGDEWVFGTGETGDNVDFKISGGAFTAANAGGNFRFFTQMSNGTPAERMLISSEGYLEINSFSAQPDDTDTSTHRKIEFKANGGGQQTHKRDCFVQNNAGSVQYHWYKIVLGSNIYGRGSNIKYTANWSTGHASGQGIVDGSFICRAQHNDSRISVHGHIVYSRQVVNGTYYGWDYDPDIELYTSTATGSSAGLYMRVQGSRTSVYDGAAIHALYLEIFGSRQDTAYQGIYHVGTSTPSDAGSAISRTILS
jgi:hypothetical protein